jgi:beta-fructofuranosidase
MDQYQGVAAPSSTSSLRARPSFHFAPRANWMNDPNGLVFFNGRYHMFFQYNPRGTAHADVCWGHATSRDLVHWEDMPVALSPTAGTADEDGCWSGCAVVHEGRAHLLYTGVSAGRQRPCLAVAEDDDLVVFRKRAEPVIADEPLSGLRGFRDHTVWVVDGAFHQLIGSGSPEHGGCVLEYRSVDLVHWEYCGVFLSAAEAGLSGEMWECPDLFALDGRWFLVVSEMTGGRTSHVSYVEGAYEGGRFRPLGAGRLDSGTRWYAPQSFTAPDGRRVSFGWLREVLTELPEDERTRVGAMSLPRRLFAVPGGGLGMEPLAGLSVLRAGPLVPRRSGGGEVALVAAAPSTAVEVEVVSEPGAVVSIGLLDDDGREVVEATVAGDVVSFGPRSPDRPPAERAHPGPGGASDRVRFFYDSGICEVFCSSGAVRSELFHGGSPLSRVVVRWATEGEPPGAKGAGRSVQAWELRGIW